MKTKTTVHELIKVLSSLPWTFEHAKVKNWDGSVFSNSKTLEVQLGHPNTFIFDEICLLLHGLEALYRLERGEPEKVPFRDADMGNDLFEKLLDLRKRFRKMVNEDGRNPV